MIRKGIQGADVDAFPITLLAAAGSNVIGAAFVDEATVSSARMLATTKQALDLILIFLKSVLLGQACVVVKLGISRANAIKYNSDPLSAIYRPTYGTTR